MPQHDPENVLAASANALRNAEALLITAGAGFGVDGGLPDFRGANGFWNAYPAYKLLGMEFSDLANPDALVENPRLFWGFYHHRIELYKAKPPHHGYQILRRLVERIGSSFVFTSNVDGHFLAAGFSPDQVVECHGSLSFLQCSRRCDDSLWSSTGLGFTLSKDMLVEGSLPVCPRCDAVARPNVLLFGDDDWVDSRMSEQYERLDRWTTAVHGRRVVVLELGAGTAIPTVRLEGEVFSRQMAASLIRVNPREAFGPRGTISLAMSALAALTEIEKLVCDF